MLMDYRPAETWNLKKKNKTRFSEHRRTRSIHLRLIKLQDNSSFIDTVIYMPLTKPDLSVKKGVHQSPHKGTYHCVSTTIKRGQEEEYQTFHGSQQVILATVVYTLCIGEIGEKQNHSKSITLITLSLKSKIL